MAKIHDIRSWWLSVSARPEQQFWFNSCRHFMLYKYNTIQYFDLWKTRNIRTTSIETHLSFIFPLDLPCSRDVRHVTGPFYLNCVCVYVPANLLMAHMHQPGSLRFEWRSWRYGFIAFGCSVPLRSSQPDRLVAVSDRVATPVSEFSRS